MRPLIAMPSRFTESADTWRVPATALGRPYQEAIVRAGGVPLAVPPLFDDGAAADVAGEVMDRADGLCLPGGPDVSPRRYGADRLHPRLIDVRDEHDALDVALALAAVAQAKPVLAICRGLQVLNVALGGSLQQHLADSIGKYRAARHHRHVNEIDVTAGSKVARALGTTLAHGHCVHHQAVERLGSGLRVTAWTEEVIEAVELPDGWVVGVQWHPEDTAATDPAQQALFDAFVAASRERVASQ